MGMPQGTDLQQEALSSHLRCLSQRHSQKGLTWYPPYVPLLEVYLGTAGLCPGVHLWVQKPYREGQRVLVVTS